MSHSTKPTQADVQSSETYEEIMETLVLTARERVNNMTTAFYRVEIPAGMPMPTVLHCGAFRLEISSQEGNR